MGQRHLGDVNNTHILLRENPSKAALLEELLYGAQTKLGIIERLVALDDLLKKDELTQDTINKLGDNFKPESEGLSVYEWSLKALEVIKR